MEIILWVASCFRYSDNIQVSAWNYRSLTAKTFEVKTLNKNEFVFRSDAHFHFAHTFFACPIRHASKIARLKNWALCKSTDSAVYQSRTGAPLCFQVLAPLIYLVLLPYSHHSFIKSTNKVYISLEKRSLSSMVQINCKKLSF